MMAPFVDIRELRCHFKSGDNLLAAVDGLNLQIRAGEVLGLVGESGSGKSTLIRCINRLEEHQEGSIIVDGNEISADTKILKELELKLGWCFSNLIYFPICLF